MSDRSDYESRQAAALASDDAIARAAGVTVAKVADRPVCLVTNFAERADLPPGTLLCRISAEVAAKLDVLGLHEPISLRQLPGKWWIANVDMASVNPVIEAGGGMATVIASSEALASEYAGNYCAVVGGPFNSREEVDGGFFVTNQFDSKMVGDRAQLCLIPNWMVRRLAEKGLVEPIPFSAMSEKWWVCGTGGGVYRTADIESALCSGKFFPRITDGPFDTKEQADYAFDLLWESPE